MYFNHRTNIKKAKPKQVLYPKGIHEPIVSEDLFYRVKDKLDDKTKIKHRIEDEDRISILSGLVTCPLCGAGMIANFTRYKSTTPGKKLKTTYAYSCVNHRKSNGRICDYAKQLNQTVVDDAVYEYVSRVKNLSSFTNYMEGQLIKSDEYDKIDTEIKALRKEYYKTENLKNKLNYMIDKIDVLNDDYDKQLDELTFKVDAYYDRLDEIEDEISNLKRQRDNIESSRITMSKIKSALEQFPELIDKMSCKDKRELMRMLIERIDVFPEKREDGKIIKSITFRFPMYRLDKHGNPTRMLDESVGYKMRCDNIGRTVVESKATYAQIRQYVWDMHQVKVNNLNIAQVKRKNGIIERKNYNVTKKGDDFKQPNCPQYKVDLIVEALKHFKMIGNEVKS